MEKYAQGSVAIVALLVVVVIGLVVGYVAFSGNLPGVTRSAEGRNGSSPGHLGSGTQESAPVQNTTIAKTPSKNTSGMSANLSATYNPADRSYFFVCNAKGFMPTVYTWDFGDGSRQILSTNKDVFYQYDKSGRYRAICIAADSKTLVNSSIIVSVP